MSYSANVYDPTNPTDAIVAETATQEFQKIKAAMVGSMARQNAVVQIVSSVNPTVIFDMTIPGGSLMSNRKLRGKNKFVISNSTGGPQNINYSLNIGATTGVIRDNGGSGISIPTGSTYGEFEFEFINESATNNQYISGKFTLYAAGSDSVIPGNMQASATTLAALVQGAFDTTQNLDLNLTVTLGINNAGFSFFSLNTFVEWI